MGQVALWSPHKGEVLNRVGVPILEPGIRKPPALDAPAAPYNVQCVQRRPALFLQAVETKRTGGTRRYVGKLLDLKVLGQLLELHKLRDRKSTRLNSSHANISYA